MEAGTQAQSQRDNREPPSVNRGQYEVVPPTSTGFPVSSGQHPDSSGGSTALCHPQVSASVSSLIVEADPVFMVCLSWSHSLNPCSQTTKPSLSQILVFFFYPWSLHHRGSCSLCSFRSRPERSPHFLLIFAVTLTRFTASISHSSEMPFFLNYL